MDFEFGIEESRNEGALKGYCNLPNVDLLHEKENEGSSQECQRKRWCRENLLCRNTTFSCRRSFLCQRSLDE